MRLCLDEHFSPEIAKRLRRRGHDVVAVGERPELRGLADRDLLRWAAGERRALLTENAADFIPLVQEWAAAGEPHAGLVLSSSRSQPRSATTVPTFVRLLDRLLDERPEESALRDQVHWLGTEE